MWRPCCYPLQLQYQQAWKHIRAKRGRRATCNLDIPLYVSRLLWSPKGANCNQKWRVRYNQTSHLAKSKCLQFNHQHRIQSLIWPTTPRTIPIYRRRLKFSHFVVVILKTWSILSLTTTSELLVLSTSMRGALIGPYLIAIRHWRLQHIPTTQISNTIFQ